MSIGSTSGISSTSFWQQDQNYWQQSQSQAQASAAETSLISAMGSIQTNLSKGLSSIANKEAITRVNNQIAADEKALAAASGSSTSSSSTPSGPAPATGTGTVPLSAITPLSTLGIPPNGTITVSDGTNTTKYSSTGTDTVTDLIGAINANLAGNAYVTASLNSSGKLVITGKNEKESVIVGGTFASDVGFGRGNQNFAPTAGSPNSSTPSSSSSSTTSSSSKATSKSSTSSNSTATRDAASAAGLAALAAAKTNSGASLLNDFGVAGSLVNMLA